MIGPTLLDLKELYRTDLDKISLIVFLRSIGSFGATFLGKSPICCAFWPACGGLQHSKAGQNTFFCAHFRIFCLFLYFCDFIQEITENRLRKQCFEQLIEVGPHPNPGWLSSGGTLFSSSFILVSECEMTKKINWAPRSAQVVDQWLTVGQL